MKKLTTIFTFITLFMILWFSPVKATNPGDPGTVQPGRGFSLRVRSNGLAWQSSTGIGLNDTKGGGNYGFQVTEHPVGIDWSANGQYQAAYPYTMGVWHETHPAITSVNYSTLCPNGSGSGHPYTQDQCVNGVTYQDVSHVMNGSGGPGDYADVSVVQMDTYLGGYQPGAPNGLYTQPLGDPGYLSSFLTFPPNNTPVQYYNGSLGIIDAGSVVNNSVTVLAYMGPNPANDNNCDQYNDCQWVQPSGFTSNFGAPNTTTNFWTHPTAQLPLLPTNYFINYNSVWMINVMQISTYNNVDYTQEGQTLFTEYNSCRSPLGGIFGRQNGNNKVVFVDHESEDIDLLNSNCLADSSNCTSQPVHDYHIAGANCSGNGLSAQYQVPEALPLLGPVMPSTDIPPLPRMEVSNKPVEMAPALQAAMNAEQVHQPNIHRLEALTDPDTHTSPVYLHYDKDGIVRWHVGVIGGPKWEGILPSPAMKMAITHEFTARGATAPIVYEKGYYVIVGK